MSLRVVVVDELPLLRAGIASTLSSMKGLQVVDTGATPDDAVRLAGHCRPDALVMGMASMEVALPSVERIVAAGVKIVCLIPPGLESRLPSLMRAGASGCLSNSARPAELLRCLETVMDGERFVSPSLAAAVLSRPAVKHHQEAPKPVASILTKRETGILELVARGRSNKDIADDLLLSEKTVKRYMTLIMQKINVRNRVQAALFISNAGSGMIV